jgi:hypothetical protein
MCDIGEVVQVAVYEKLDATPAPVEPERLEKVPQEEPIVLERV